MKYEISSILLMLAFIFGIASFATTTYGGDKKQTNTWSITIQKSKEDRKTDLPKIIPTVWIEKTKEKSISKIANHVKSSTDQVRTPKQIYEQVKHLGYREDPAISLISACKGSSWDPRHCILVWLVLMYNEAWNQQNSKACIDRNNCFGIQSGKKSYSSLEEGMENFVQKYNKYWINAKWPEFFYSKSWSLPKSRYCTSESSSKSSVGCPMWLSIATNKWNQLKSIIY